MAKKKVDANGDVQTTIRMSAQFARDLKAACAKHDITQKDLLISLAVEWLESNSLTTPAKQGITQTPSTLTPKSSVVTEHTSALPSDLGVCQDASHQQWNQPIANLVAILNASDEEAASAILANLQVFRRVLKDNQRVEFQVGSVGAEAAAVHGIQGVLVDAAGHPGQSDLDDTQRGAAIERAKRALEALSRTDEAPPPELPTRGKRSGQPARRDDRAGKLGGGR